MVRKKYSTFEEIFFGQCTSEELIKNNASRHKIKAHEQGRKLFLHFLANRLLFFTRHVWLFFRLIGYKVNTSELLVIRVDLCHAVQHY